MKRLMVRAIKKPIENSYSMHEQQVEGLIAELPEEIREQGRARCNAKKADDEELRKADRTAFQARESQWLQDSSNYHADEDEGRAAFRAFDAARACRTKGYVAAALKPFMICSFEWWLLDGNGSETRGVFERLKEAGRIHLPLAIEGGSLTIMIESKKVLNPDGEIETLLEPFMHISGVIDGDYVSGSLVRVDGLFDVMNSAIVKLRAGSKPAHAKRIAALFDFIQDHIVLPRDLSAIIAPSDQCFQCGRELDDPISKTLFIGPACAKSLGVPHTIEAARRITDLRQAYHRQFHCEEA